MRMMSKTSRRARGANILPKACEGCRVRKIRCNKSNPCSNCEISGIECRPSNKSTDPKPQSTGSHYYDKQFSLLNERLSRMEKTLEEACLKAAVSGPPQGYDPFSSVEGNSSAVAGPLFQGGSSFSSQTMRASLSADVAVTQKLDSVQNTEIHNALTSLRELLHGRNGSPYLNELQFPRAQLEISREGDLPPAAFVITLLRKVKVKPSLASLEFASRGEDQFENLCQRAYFPSEPLISDDFTLLNGWLYYLIQEFRLSEDPDLAGFDCEAFQDMCETNFVTGIQNYDYMSVPTLTTLQCFILGAVKAQESSRPALCWNLVCTASRMCQNLGYHRRSALQNDPMAETKRHAFWMLYRMEKNLALTFGRASSFPDYDIDVELFTPSSDLRIRPWDLMVISFIRFATSQGQIYEKLYSAQAISAQPAERMREAEDLASKLSAWHVEISSIDGQYAHYRDEFLSSVASADFIYYTMLTILYRENVSSASTTEISSQCFEAARMSLECHLQACGKYSTKHVSRWTAYIDWVLLYMPFTPFVVVFTHALATRSERDVKLLEEVLESLSGARVLSEAAERLHRVCAEFVRIARLFLSSIQISFGSYDADTSNFRFPTATEHCVNQTYQDLESGEFEAGCEFTTADLNGISSILGDWVGEINSFKLFD